MSVRNPVLRHQWWNRSGSLVRRTGTVVMMTLEAIWASKAAQLGILPVRVRKKRPILGMTRRCCFHEHAICNGSLVIASRINSSVGGDTIIGGKREVSWSPTIKLRAWAVARFLLRAWWACLAWSVPLTEPLRRLRGGRYPVSSPPLSRLSVLRKCSEGSGAT